MMSLQHIKPVKIPFDSLVSERVNLDPFGDGLLKELQDVGMVSITQIPNLKEMKNEALSWTLHSCAQESSVGRSHKYPDGTVRRTLATHTIPGGSAKLNHQTDSTSCGKFDKAIVPFRAAVDDVTKLFATRLSLLLDNLSDFSAAPLLMTEDRFPFSTVAEIVEHGEHLEHFHSYQHFDERTPASDQHTIDFHLDQGLFLVFAPGRMTHQDASRPASLSTGFMIELPDGSPAIVDFDDDDDLVILLGDGVNQYINPHFSDVEGFRALPHALSLSKHSQDQARVWYGRMVLPPGSAVHPQHKKTFDELREDLIKASRMELGRDKDGDIDVLSLGCASTSHIARQLEEMSCSADTLLCWHKCMSLAEFNVSDDICSGQGKELFCINPRGQLWDGNHGDFFPGCATNDTEIATPFPTLPSYPRDADVCTNASFAEFASLMPYENQINLGAAGAIFLWNVSDGHVHGRLAFNGLLGYLAVGLANVGGAKNGMHGANILMAIPGGNYSAITGFDLSIDPSIQEFQISPDPEESSFRFWGVDNDVTAQSRHGGMFPELDITDCFSSFTFEAESINGVPFKLSGVDQLLWAANDIDSFAGYHGLNRGRFSIEWASGQAKLYEADEEEAAPPSSGARVGLVLSLFLLVVSLMGL